MVTKLLKDSRGNTLADSIAVASSFWSRTKGLLGKKSLSFDEGLLITNCSSIHMFGMRMPLDIVFLSEDFTVLALRKKLSPFWLASHSKARHTLELAAGAVEQLGIEIGDKVSIEGL